MNITSAKYQTDYEGNKGAVEIIVDGRAYSVPIKSENRHYQAILEWVKAGNTIEEAD